LAQVQQHFGLTKILKENDLYLYDYFIYPNLIQSLLQRKQGKVTELVNNDSIILSWGLSIFVGGAFSKENGEKLIAYLKDLSSPRYLYEPDNKWRSFLKSKLSDRLIDKQINAYIFDIRKDIDYINDEHIVEITPNFMIKNYKNSNYIINELYSYTNIKDFFNHGAGVALVFNDEIVGFCLSEYSIKDSLGANIWIADKFQGFGYAKKLTNAFLLACQRKNKNVYWVCDNDNIRSNKVAKSTGFEFETCDHYFEI